MVRMVKLTEDHITKAQNTPLDATENPVFTDGGHPSPEVAPAAPASGDGWTPSAFDDPALEEADPNKPLSEKQREWTGLLIGVFKASATTLDIVGSPVTLDESEAEQLAECWGDVLGHYQDLQDGTRKGDIAKAVAETSIITGSKLKQLKAQRNESAND